MVYSLKEWAERMENTIIRYLVYKRFSPEEAHFVEEEFTSTTYELGYINNIIDTGYGLMLEIEGCDDEGRTGIKSFYRLEELRIDEFDVDNKGGDEVWHA